MGRLSWIAWVVPKCKHKSPDKRRAEGDHRQRGEGSVTTEAENGVMWSQGRDAGSHWKLEGGKNKCPLEPPMSLSTP